MANGLISAVGPAASVGSGAAPTPVAPADASRGASPPAGLASAGGKGAEKPPPPDAEAVRQAVEHISAFVKSSQRNLEFSLDRETGIMVVKVVDTESGEVIRQIPPEETLAIAKQLDSAQGVLFRSKV